jgi:hypothetical protein
MPCASSFIHSCRAQSTCRLPMRSAHDHDGCCVQLADRHALHLPTPTSVAGSSIELNILQPLCVDTLLPASPTIVLASCVPTLHCTARAQPAPAAALWYISGRRALHGGMLHRARCPCQVPDKNSQAITGLDRDLVPLFFESRILTCLTYTSRRGSQHRGQTAEQEDTKARKAKLQRPRTAAQGSLSHKVTAGKTS